MKEDTENLIRLERIKGRIELLDTIYTQPIPKQIVEDLRWMEKKLREHLTNESKQMKFTYLSPEHSGETPFDVERGRQKQNVTGSTNRPPSGPFKQFETQEEMEEALRFATGRPRGMQRWDEYCSQEEMKAISWTPMEGHFGLQQWRNLDNWQKKI